MFALVTMALTTAIEIFAAGAVTTVTIYSICKTGKKEVTEKERADNLFFLVLTYDKPTVTDNGT